MNPFDIIDHYYKKGSDLYNTLVIHSRDVTNKALEVARKHPELNIDEAFVEEAGMLHDIAISLTDTPSIGCNGIAPYICHGYLGRELLEELGYPKHALVCERHTGTGIRLEEILIKNLPLPHRDMIPVSIEEEVICFADCFFSKSQLGQEKTVEEVREGLAKFGIESVEKFDNWCKIFL